MKIPLLHPRSAQSKISLVLLDKKIYQNNWKAENRSQLEGKIRIGITKNQQTEPEIFQKLLANLKKKIAFVKNHGH